MKLRSGKTYYYKAIKTEKKTYKKQKTKHTNFCCICCENYKKGEYITSCKDSNLEKHTYHLSCILEVMQTCIDLGQSRICPYCRINLNYTNINIITIR